jgi:hypothetical protein
MKFDLKGWENISLIRAYHLRITPINIMIVEKHLYTFNKKGFGCFRGEGTLDKFSHVNKNLHMFVSSKFQGACVFPHVLECILEKKLACEEKRLMI